MRYLVLQINGGVIHRLRYDPRSVDDRLYVLRQLEDLCGDSTAHLDVRIWREDERC